MSQLLVAKHRVRGLDGRSATVSIARIMPDDDSMFHRQDFVGIGPGSLTT